MRPREWQPNYDARYRSVLASTVPHNRLYVVDSGAEKDLSTETGNFDSLCPCTCPLVQADGTPLTLNGTGTIYGIPDAISVPSLNHAGLLSVAKMVDQHPDSSVTFGSTSISLNVSGSLFASGPCLGDLYFIDPASTLNKYHSIMPAQSTHPVN